MARLACAMDEPLYLRKEYRTANEPKVPDLISKSFVFVPSAGMRLAPEVLVLELMREVFIGSHSNQDLTKAKDIDPEERDDNGNNLFTDRERAVLYALQGRRKKTRSSTDQTFFAPAYPQLAENGWFRKNSESIIKYLLFSGPIAQDVYQGNHGGKTPETRIDEVSKLTWQALLGNKSCLDHDLKGKDILAATLEPDSFKEKYKDFDSAKKNLVQMISSRKNALMPFPGDHLSACITRDFEEICKLEGEIPRMQWLHLLMTFLRFALPMWLLAQMRITRILHQWVIAAVDGEGEIPSLDQIQDELANRNRYLLQPTLVPTRELFDHIDAYMKCRVELNIFLYCLSAARKDELDITDKNRAISLNGKDSRHLGIEHLLLLARESSSQIKNLDRFKEIADGLNVRTFLARESEQFSAWRNPRKSGVGKNIDEFFRVLYQSETGDESGGYLLVPRGQGVKRGFVVFPGQLLLNVIAYLSARDKLLSHGSAGGILVLQDLEDHFARYGIDFSIAADARPMLMERLQSMGLLHGSPDAGSSVAVEIPY